MRVAIVGGKLQGIEAAFLACEAGWETVLIDKKHSPPAAGLCSAFCQCDVVEERPFLRRILQNVELIIPAIENTAALQSLQKNAADVGTSLAFDAEAYFISHSKKRSNRLLEKLGIPVPRRWPDCGLPVIVKPSASSGSRGVFRLNTEHELKAFMKTSGSLLRNGIAQEYLEGPSYSVEVIGRDGDYTALQVAELGMDNRYDCNRVLAPAEIPAALNREIKEIACVIARALNLKGLMDVEVILDRGVPKVLEIDARLPSQTPTVVYKSTGINMIELLRDIFVTSTMPEISERKMPRGVVYEHVKVSPKGVEFPGEHVMGEADSLQVIADFFGAEVGVTNFNASQSSWTATLITTGENRNLAWLKRQHVIENILRSVGGSHENRKSSALAGIANVPSLVGAEIC